MAARDESAHGAPSARGRAPRVDPALGDLAVRVLGHYAGPEPGAEALASAAARSYGELVRVVAPLIGHVGAASLTGRALHLAARAHPCLVRTREQEQGANPFAQVVACVRQQDPAVGTAAAAAVFAIFTSLLGTFIGELLTQRLLRKAWPDVFFDAAPEEIEER